MANTARKFMAELLGALINAPSLIKCHSTKREGREESIVSSQWGLSGFLLPTLPKLNAQKVGGLSWQASGKLIGARKEGVNNLKLLAVMPEVAC